MSLHRIRRKKAQQRVVLPVFIGLGLAVLAGCPQARFSNVPTVDGVTINAADTAYRGEATRLTATVSGTNNPSQDVNWYIVGDGRHPETRIDSRGFLHVAAGETLDAVTVGARSAVDPRHFSRVRITVAGEGYPVPVNPLERPYIGLAGSVVFWDGVPGAGGYSLRIAGVEAAGGGLGRNARSFNLADLSLVTGSHAVTLVAVGVPGFSYDSPPSNTVTYTLTGSAQPGLPRLDAPVITLSGSALSWPAVSGAGGYSLRVGGVEANGGDLGPGAEGFDLASLALAVGDHEITLTALGVSGVSLNSPESNAVTYTVTVAVRPGLPQLDAPLIALDGLRLSWGSVYGASGYSLRVGGIPGEGVIPAGTTHTDIGALGLPPGVHVITLTALGVSGVSLDSPASNPVIPDLGYLLNRLPAPVITLDRYTSTLTWPGVPGAGGYSLRVNGTEPADGSLGRNARSFNLAWLSLGIGPHEITLVAVGVPGQSLDSLPSNPVIYDAATAGPVLPRLTAPVITLTGSSVVWNAVPGAGGYSLRVGGVEAAGGDLGPGARSFNLAGLNLLSGYHSVTLTAIGVPGVSLDSPPSNAVIYAVPPGAHPGLSQLPAPVITLTGSSVVWNAVPGAGGYSLRVGGIEVSGGNLTPGTAAFDLAGLGLPEGDHIITLVALGVSGVSLDSPASNAETFTVKPDAQPGLPVLDAPVIELYGETLRWQAVSGAAGYSLLVNGAERAAPDNLATDFRLADLGLPVGTHTVTLIALGVPGQSLNSPVSNAVTFYVMIYTSVIVTVTLPDMRDMAGYLDIRGPDFSMTGEPGQIVFDRGYHDVTAVEWLSGGRPVPEGTVRTDGTLYTLTLDSRIHGNMEGPHFVTLEVETGGRRYSRTVAFTVRL